jgi:hypothetical protein
MDAVKCRRYWTVVAVRAKEERMEDCEESDRCISLGVASEVCKLRM